jgi:hypothetical protein
MLQILESALGRVSAQLRGKPETRDADAEGAPRAGPKLALPQTVPGAASTVVDSSVSRDLGDRGGLTARSLRKGSARSCAIGFGRSLLESNGWRRSFEE